MERAVGIEPTTLAWTLRLERVLDTDPCDRLPRVEILREKSLRARLCGRRDDEGVPKSDSCLVLDTKGCCEVEPTSTQQIAYVLTMSRAASRASGFTIFRVKFT